MKQLVKPTVIFTILVFDDVCSIGISWLVYRSCAFSCDWRVWTDFPDRTEKVQLKLTNKQMRRFIYKSFHLRVESKTRSSLFCVCTLTDWLKKTLAPTFRPIRSKTKTTCDLLPSVFPRFEPASCICLGVSIGSVDY